MSQPPHNSEPTKDSKSREDRLVDWARQMDEHLENGQADSISESLSAVSADDLPDLQHVERALMFLDKARDNLDVLACMAAGAMQDSLQVANDTTFQGSVVADSSDPVSPCTGPHLPSTFGRFEILDVLGQGGFAKVFLASDPLLNRLVALKIPLKQTFEDHNARRRFEREARAAAVLSHPAIVPIFETGVEGETAYIAFGYCPGPNLSQWLATQRGQVSLRTAATIVAKLAEATQHAHQRGIVHRDLKPGNVLLHHEPANIAAAVGDSTSSDTNRTVVCPPSSPSDQDAVADKIRITDFGLARIDSSFDETITVEGSVIGTPAYMSPEQARGQRDVGPASDIFSLGAILYELLTAERPFIRDTHLSTLRAIEEDSPRPPRQVRGAICKGLEAICLKCLRKTPERRYASAHELADDLNRWMNGQPILARPASSWDKVRAWSKRNPALSVAMLLGFISFAAGLAGTTWQWREARANLAKSEAEYARAERAAAEEQQARKRAEQVARFLSFTYRSVDPEMDGRDAKVVDMLARARKEIPIEFADDNETRWMLQRQVAATYMKLGVVKGCLEVLEPIWEERKATRSTENEETVRLLMELSVATNFAADQSRSLAFANDALQLAKQMSAPQRLLAKCQQSKAVALQNMGRREEAIVCYRAAIDSFSRDPDSKPRDVPKVRFRLGMTLRAMGKVDDASALLEASMKELTDLLGPDHPDTIDVMAEYANVLHAQGRKFESVDLRQSLVAFRERVQGPEHPRTLLEMSNLAANLAAIGRADEAVPIFQTCVARAERVMGAQSPYTLMPILQLGSAYQRLYQLDLARDSFETAYAGMRQAFSPTHHWTAKCSRNLGHVLEWTEDWSSLEELFQQRADDFTDEFGADNDDARLFRALLGVVKIRQGKAEEGIAAVQEYIESLKTMEDVSGRESIELTMYARLWSALLGSEHYELAAQHAARYRELASKAQDSKHEMFSRFHQGHLLALTGNVERAAECLRPWFDTDWENAAELDDSDWIVVASSVLALADLAADGESPLHEYGENLEGVLVKIPELFRSSEKPTP